MNNLLNIMIKLNGLQYNPNRDPQVYRRCIKEPFRIQALLGGSGEARCGLYDAQGGLIAEQTVELPGTYTHELAFDAPGTRIVTLTVETGGQSSSRDLRLDVLEHAWVG